VHHKGRITDSALHCRGQTESSLITVGNCRKAIESIDEAASRIRMEDRLQAGSAGFV